METDLLRHEICMLCGNKTKNSDLCPPCTGVVYSNPAMKDFYRECLERLNLQNTRFRDRLLRDKQTAATHKAKKRLRKIVTEVFHWKVEVERIFRPYFVDFYIKEAKIGIEIDGGCHETRGSYDLARDEFIFKRYHVTIHRFLNEQVGTDFFRKAIYQICLRAIVAEAENQGLL